MELSVVHHASGCGGGAGTLLHVAAGILLGTVAAGVADVGVVVR